MQKMHAMFNEFLLTLGHFSIQIQRGQLLLLRVVIQKNLGTYRPLGETSFVTYKCDTWNERYDKYVTS